jgi:hypothetical protein
MGGFGSTRWTCENIKDTVEGNRYLEVNRMSREGWLRAGCRGTLEWTRNGEPFGSIRFRREGNFLILSYCVQQSGGEWRDVEQRTLIVWTGCRFGGRRPYFMCPGVVNGVDCGRRATKLYGAGTYFLCRHCYHLAYASQREGPYDRALCRVNKIRSRLGGDPGLRSPFPERPKGMHHRTYKRLRSEAWGAEMMAKAELGISLRRVLEREQQFEENRANAIV